MKYNIIGDIHGRTSWRDLVIDDGVNIFVGDYFSPYHKEITWEIQRDNFLDIMGYKKEHPETVLLIGNHDEDHWHWKDSGCSRHNFEHENDIRQLFEEFSDYFQAAYSIENTVLVTHAGLSVLWLHNVLYKRDKTRELINLNWGAYWECDNFIEALKTRDNDREESYKRNCEYSLIPPLKAPNLEHKDFDIALWRNDFYVMKDGGWKKFLITPNEAANMVNEIWKNNPNIFSFSVCSNYRDDTYGDSETHSPMWIRYDGLKYTNVFKGTNYVQIYGHTMCDKIDTYNDYMWDGMEYMKTDTGKMVMVDCLEFKNNSYIIKTK